MSLVCCEKCKRSKVYCKCHMPVVNVLRIGQVECVWAHESGIVEKAVDQAIAEITTEHPKLTEFAVYEKVKEFISERYINYALEMLVYRIINNRKKEIECLQNN